MSEEVTIRIATPEDGGAILRIYAEYIRNTAITFETEVPTEEAFLARMERIQKHFPWLVCEINGELAGYAYGSKHGERAAYRWSADLSVYIAEKFHRRHVGAALYDALLSLLRRQGYYTVYAGVSTPNPNSEAFHTALGFSVVGVYPRVGYKLGAWRNLTWYALPLRPYEDEPAEPKSFHDALGEAERAKLMSTAVQTRMQE